MDGIRFILEDPQAANSRQKKRSRLVTACDTCRAKKIKCHQSPGASKCEACRLSKSACRFRDRERYHAQRSGSLSASSSNFNPSDSEDSQSFTESPGFVARRATLPTLGHYHSQQSRSSSLPPALPRLPNALGHRTGSPNSEVGPHRMRKTSTRRNIGPVASADYPISHGGRRSGQSTPSLIGISPLSSFRNLAIDDYSHSMQNYFDSARPGYPSPKYMEHALELFSEYFGSRFLFLHYDALRHTMLEQALPAPFANCIAALSLRFSLSPELPGNSRVFVGEPYLEMAKDLIIPLAYTPSVENLHSLLLLSWCEYGSGRENGLNVYSSLAIRMALDLGLGNEETIKSLTTEHERTDLRQTWWSVVMLDIISSWITGNPAHLSLQACTTVLPKSSFATSDHSLVSVQYFTLYELLSLRDKMLRILSFNFSSNIQGSQETELQDIRSRLLSIQLSLPPDLEFNVVNLRRAVQDRQDTVFIFLHLILNSLIGMSHYPSIFRSFPTSPRVPEIVTSSARTILDVVVMMEQVDTHAVTSTPFLDFPLAIAARAFALESRAEQEMSASLEDLTVANRGRFAEVSYGVCNNYLTRMTEHWGNVHNVQMAVQSGSVWNYVCPVQQSPVAIPSALDLHGVDYAHTSRLHIDQSPEHQELALTYSDSDLSREPSPLLFEFPGLINTSASQRVTDAEQMQRPSSDPTPTTMLPPVSLAGGEVATYEDLTNYMAPYSGDSQSSSGRDLEYFSAMHASECLPSVYNGDGNRSVAVAQSFPPSPWWVEILSLVAEPI
ncbi:hypothetical protein ACEPAH_6941 [Sanghuangporus vaninii]